MNQLFFNSVGKKVIVYGFFDQDKLINKNTNKQVQWFYDPGTHYLHRGVNISNRKLFTVRNILNWKKDFIFT